MGLSWRKAAATKRPPRDRLWLRHTSLSRYEPSPGRKRLAGPLVAPLGGRRRRRSGGALHAYAIQRPAPITASHSANDASVCARATPSALSRLPRAWKAAALSPASISSVILTTNV